MQRVLILLGVLAILAGLAWPYLSKLGLFRLPGDIVIERETVRFYFPITTMLILSAVISLILWIFRR